ncbi:MAG: hypothetical protein PWP65_1523 [Clostridia bacterium]|nr:hypothetical protein [Clostridia bacterium]
MYVSTYSPWQSAWGLNPMQSGFSPYASPGIGMMPGINISPGAVSYSFIPAAAGAMSFGFNPNIAWQGTGGQVPLAAGQFGMAPAVTSAIQAGAGLVQPRIELAETNSDIVITAELPNVNPNNLHLTATDDSVTISALALSPGGMATSIHRTIALPTPVRCEQVEASYANGILEARLPKSDVAARRRVRVNVVG